MTDKPLRHGDAPSIFKSLLHLISSVALKAMRK